MVVVETRIPPGSAVFLERLNSGRDPVPLVRLEDWYTRTALGENPPSLEALSEELAPMDCSSQGAAPIVSLRTLREFRLEPQ